MLQKKTKAVRGKLDREMEKLYDALMAEIEPDLTTKMIPLLDEIYETETEEERKERGERYADAFELFASRFSSIIEMWKEELLAFKEQALATLKEKTGKEEKKALEDIERSIEEQ